MDGHDVRGRDQPAAGSTEGNQLAMPADGHEWKKYGQKYIIRIAKNRSYFKCRRNNCGAKKKAEWPPNDTGNLRIVYEGEHIHPPPTASDDQDASGSNSAYNRYDLRNQVFGRPNEPS